MLDSHHKQIWEIGGSIKAGHRTVLFQLVCGSELKLSCQELLMLMAEGKMSVMGGAVIKS